MDLKPLGSPHDGPDTKQNIICLCPNHHVMFDKGTFAILDDYSLTGEEEGILFVDTRHKVDSNNLKYHRDSHGFDYSRLRDNL